MSTEAEVRQAFDDFEHGLLCEIPRDHPLAPTYEIVAAISSGLD